MFPPLEQIQFNDWLASKATSTLNEGTKAILSREPV